MPGIRRCKIVLGKAIELLATNPLLFARLLALQTKRLLPLPRQGARRKVFGLEMKFDFALDPGIKLMYRGVYEPLTIAAMKRLLRSGDTVLDVGANIGYMTAVAAGLVGPSGQVHAFEPEPRCFGELQHLCRVNPGYNIVANQCAAGEQNGTVKLGVAVVGGLVLSSAVPGQLNEKTLAGSIEVPMVRLDSYIKQHGLAQIALIKIDVEGFELPVLGGLRSYLENADRPPAIVCEINPYALRRLGAGCPGLARLIEELDYDAFSLVNTKKRVHVATLDDLANVLLLPKRGPVRAEGQ